MNIFVKIKSFLNKYAITILVVAILLYITVFFGLSYYKYINFLYNSLDLAIFNQVFFNTSHGRFFQLSIHAPTYLGDHFSLIILPLSFLYSFYRHPLTLLFFQTVVLALSAWPVYLIAKKILKGKIWPLILSLVWLVNPLVHNANLFEFHILPFAQFFLLWVYYFYLQKKWRLFFLFCILSLMVREDVSLVLFMMGVLLFLESLQMDKNISDKKYGLIKRLKSLKVVSLQQLFIGLIVTALSFGWFALGMKIISNYSTDGGYKFLLYYSWLGSSFFDILISPFLRPLTLLTHLITIPNIEMFFGLLLPFVFLPLYSKKYLILLIGPLLQFLLGAPGGSALIFQTHYSLLMLPSLVISTIYAIKYFRENPVGQKSSIEIVRILTVNKGFLFVLFISGAIFSSITLGPLFGSLKTVFSTNVDSKAISVKNNFLAKIPATAKVVATSEYLNNLSSREQVYSMHYVYIGKKQFSEKEYTIPSDTDYLMINFNEFLEYPVQFKEHLVYGQFFEKAGINMDKLLRDYILADVFDMQMLFRKRGKSENYKNSLYSKSGSLLKRQTTLAYEDKISFKGWQINEEVVEGEMYESAQILPLSLFWQANKDMGDFDNYQLKMIVYDDGNIVYEKLYPLAYNIFPVTDWSVGETVQTNYWFYIPEKISNEAILQFALIEPDDHLELNSFRQAQFFGEGKPLSPNIIIDKIGNIRQ